MATRQRLLSETAEQKNTDTGGGERQIGQSRGRQSATAKGGVGVPNQGQRPEGATKDDRGVASHGNENAQINVFNHKGTIIIKHGL